MIALPPTLGPIRAAGPGGDGEVQAAPISLALPPGCPAVELRVFEASEDPDPFAGRRVIDELLRLRQSSPSDEELAGWLTAPHAHVWQADAALALALPRLLAARAGPAQTPTGEAGAERLADGMLELALTPLRTEESTGSGSDRSRAAGRTAPSRATTASGWS